MGPELCSFQILGVKLQVCFCVGDFGREEVGVRKTVHLSVFPCNLLFKAEYSDLKASCSLFVSPRAHQ